MFNKKFCGVFTAFFFLFLLSGLASAACSSTSVTTSTTISTATTGTNVVITGSMSPQSSCSDDVSFVSTGQSSGASLTVNDPASGLYQGASIQSGTTKTFTVTAGVADQYSYNVRVGSTLSTPTGLITFINPSALSVSGSPSSRTVTASGQTFAYEVTVSNPSASDVTTSYSLSYSGTYFSLTGDPTATTITIPAGSSTTLRWTVTVSSGAFSSTSITFALGSNNNAFSGTVTGPNTTPTPTPSTSTPPGSGGSSPTPTASVPAATAQASSQLPRPPVSAPVPQGEVIAEETSELPSQTLVVGDESVQLDLSRTLTVQKASDGMPSSVFTLSVANPSDVEMKVRVVERIPGSVATMDDYNAGLLNFNPAPSSVKEGSVIATYAALSVPAGGSVEVKYWLEGKELSTAVLNDFSTPKLSVVSSVKTPAKPSLVASTGPTGTGPFGAGPVSGQENTWLYLVLGLVIAVGLYFVFAKKK